MTKRPLYPTFHPLLMHSALSTPMCFTAQMENKLLNTPGKESGMMTEAEYSDSSDACLSIVNDSLRRKLFRESQAYVQEKDKLNGGVPVLRLARILAATC